MLEQLNRGGRGLGGDFAEDLHTLQAVAPKVHSAAASGRNRHLQVSGQVLNRGLDARDLQSREGSLLGHSLCRDLDHERDRSNSDLASGDGVIVRHGIHLFNQQGPFGPVPGGALESNSLSSDFNMAWPG